MSNTRTYTHARTHTHTELGKEEPLQYILFYFIKQYVFIEEKLDNAEKYKKKSPTTAHHPKIITMNIFERNFKTFFFWCMHLCMHLDSQKCDQIISRGCYHKSRSSIVPRGPASVHERVYELHFALCPCVSWHQTKIGQYRGFPGGAVVESLPANAGNTGSSPGLGRCHMPRSN